MPIARGSVFDRNQRSRRDGLARRGGRRRVGQENAVRAEAGAVGGPSVWASPAWRRGADTFPVLRCLLEVGDVASVPEGRCVRLMLV